MHHLHAWDTSGQIKRGGDAMGKDKTKIVVIVAATIIISLLVISLSKDTIQVNVKLDMPKAITIDIKKGY